MRILITGSSGCLAGALLPALCGDAAIEQVTGIDVRAATFEHPKFHPHRIDVCAGISPSLLRGHDALVHLACAVLRGRMDERAMREVNVTATLRLLQRAAEGGVERLIALSSAAVYGSGRDLDEHARFAPLTGFRYAAHKAAMEQLIAAELPHCLRLRPHVILGRHAQPLLRWLLHQPCYLRVPAPEPLLQCVHEQDVVAAIRLALGSPLAGGLNLASNDAFSFPDAIRQRHRWTLALPRPLARSLLRSAWHLTGFGAEPGWIEGLAYPLTLNCEKARRELGWIPRYTSLQALSETT